MDVMSLISASVVDLKSTAKHKSRDRSTSTEVYKLKKIYIVTLLLRNFFGKELFKDLLIYDERL